MVFLPSANGEKWPRLEVKVVSGKLVFIMWLDMDTPADTFVADGLFDLNLLHNLVNSCKLALGVTS